MTEKNLVKILKITFPMHSHSSENPDSERFRSTVENIRALTVQTYMTGSETSFYIKNWISKTHKIRRQFIFQRINLLVNFEIFYSPSTSKVCGKMVEKCFQPLTEMVLIIKEPYSYEFYRTINSKQEIWWFSRNSMKIRIITRRRTRKKG